MPTRLGLVVVAVIATLSLFAGACGDDDDSGGAVAPSPENAFGGLRTALEAEGMTVASLPKDQLSGAESGVEITGSRSGTGLLFGSEEEAEDYSDSKSGSAKTARVGTVVFTADSQADADFFASAYEGG